MKDSIGYIQVKAMWLFADIELSDSLIAKNGSVSTYIDALAELPYAEQTAMETKGISKVMDVVMHDLWDTQSIIIDVRFNGGGIDEVGLEILRRFNSKRKQIAAKKARHENGFTRTKLIYLEPASETYLKPVYLLTSQQSASATDMMALSSLEFENILRIGSHTNGAISDALEKTLPNGWYMSLSNEVYMDLEGNHYENKCIPVHYELNYPEDRQDFFRSVANDLEQDTQDILKAISELQK